MLSDAHLQRKHTEATINIAERSSTQLKAESAIHGKTKERGNNRRAVSPLLLQKATEKPVNVQEGLK